MNKDYENIKKCVRKALNVSDLLEMTKLTKLKLLTTMILHPSLFFEIKKQLKIKKYVIDASISETNNLYERLRKLCENNSIIIITSVTQKELTGLRNRDDLILVADIDMILAMRRKRKKSFRYIEIDESLEKPDDRIVKFCEENKKRVILMTSDKEMAANAREKGVEVQYIAHENEKKPRKKSKPKHKKNNPVKTITEKKEEVKNPKILTLDKIKKENDDIYIKLYHDKYEAILIYMKDGKVYNTGKRKLNVGDHVYIAMKTGNGTKFTDYRIISKNLENNCEEVYTTTIYKKDGLDNLKEEYRYYYKNFMLSKR